ncbi:MAG: TonB-dependent receptor [Verrucomicrobiota bacterium]|nr:TonB-dependent receptor [Verrucomicrobiota bacterium]
MKTASFKKTGMAAWIIMTVAAGPAAQASATTNSPAAGAEAVLPEMVVTPLRIARDVNSEPITVYRLDASDGALRQAVRSTPDALQGIPSVFAQKTSYGQGSPFLRGFTGFRTLCLIDGIRLNNSVFRDGPNQYWGTVDSLSVADYELIMGPASVMYGSDAVGGALNALPIRPPEFAGSPAWQGRLYGRRAGADASTVGRAQFGTRLSQSLGFVGGFSLKEFGDLKGGRDVGAQEHTGYRERDYDVRMDYRLGGDSTLTVAHQGVNQDGVWRTHRTIYGIAWEGLQVGDEKAHTLDQRRGLTYLKYRGAKPNGPVNAVECALSRHVQTEDLYRVKKDDKSEEQGFDVTAWGGALQLRSDTSLGQWVYGTEYYFDDVSSYARKHKADGRLDKVEIQGPVADDAAYQSLGVYVADTIRLLAGRLDVVPGARYTFARADADQVEDPVSGDRMTVEDDWNTVVGSLRFLVPLSDDRRHVVFAGASQGFRAPNLSDLTRLDIARSSEIETPSPDLDPEEYVAWEIGLKSRFERLTSRVGYYYTMIDKMILRAPTGRSIDEYAEVTKKNSGQGYIQGIELAETLRLTPQWSARVSAAWMDGQVDAYPTSDAVKERDYISRLMPPTAEVTLRRQTETGKYWCEAVGKLAAKADKLSADDERDIQRIPPGGTPGYAVCHVRAGARLIDGPGVTVALENVLDEDYRIHGSGVNEPGRNLVLAADWTF